jgi:signal transduction histidine kinase
MSDSKEPDNPSLREQAAELIEQNVEDILSRWETYVRRDIPAARHQEKILLRDHLVPYLSTLAEMLKRLSIKSARHGTKACPDFDTSANEIHGRMRATLPGYSVDEVIDEYIALRQTISDFVEANGLLDAEVQEVICAANEKAILHAATHFTGSLQILRQRAVSMLMHDIRNPLNVVSITAELVKAKSEDHAKSMDTVLANTRKIDKMVTELLDAVRLEAGQGLELMRPSRYHQSVHRRRQARLPRQDQGEPAGRIVRRDDRYCCSRPRSRESRLKCDQIR